MTAVMLQRPTDVESRLKVWRERWQYAPSPLAKAHAQAAIDYWLDRRLAPVDGGDSAVPPQRAGTDLGEPITA